jgi:DNA-binding CsgD family transcriptional regulator
MSKQSVSHLAAPVRDHVGMSPARTKSKTLTPRELAVVQLLASGCSYREVAARLGISPHTVVTHVKNVYRKLEVHTAAAAVMRAVQLGFIRP